MKNVIGYALTFLIGAAAVWFLKKDHPPQLMDITEYFLMDDFEMQSKIQGQRTANLTALQNQINEMPNDTSVTAALKKFFAADEKIKLRINELANEREILGQIQSQINPPVPPLPPPPPPCGSGRCIPMLWKGDLIFPVDDWGYKATITAKDGEQEIASTGPLANNDKLGLRTSKLNFTDTEFSGAAILTLTVDMGDGKSKRFTTEINMAR